MIFDFRIAEKEFYFPEDKPEIIQIPPMNFVAISGKGDPYDKNGTFQQAIKLLYTISYAINDGGKYSIAEFFNYAIPPLESLWWTPEMKIINFSRKKGLRWIILNRLPDFVKKTDLDWAITKATQDKDKEYARIIFLPYKENLCVQCMQYGAYENREDTVLRMEEYAKEKGYIIDITTNRLHHEIYLNSPDNCETEDLKTIIRLPIKGMFQVSMNRL